MIIGRVFVPIRLLSWQKPDLVFQHTLPLLVYYSSPSLNTHRFVERLALPARRIPVSLKKQIEQIRQPFVLISPTYANDDGSKAVPKQVIHFLNNPDNRALMLGVISSGNRNFGSLFAHAGVVISKKCNVPLLYKFELSGTSDDVANVTRGIETLWGSLILKNSQIEENSG